MTNSADDQVLTKHAHTLELIAAEARHQPKTFAANYDLHAVRLLPIAQAFQQAYEAQRALPVFENTPADRIVHGLIKYALDNLTDLLGEAVIETVNDDPETPERGTPAHAKLLGEVFDRLRTAPADYQYRPSKES